MIRLLRRKRLFLAFVVIILLPAAFLVWFLFLPPSGTSETKVIFIKKGTPLRKIAEVLEQERIIKNRNFFVYLTQALGKRSEIKAGEYELHTGMVPLEVIEVLVKGQVKQHLVTIPEGYTVRQIAQLLEDLQIVEKDAFLQKATSATLIVSLGIPLSAKPSLEGYLFPNTYHLYREMDPEEVIRIMVNQYRKTFNSDLSAKAAQFGISEREAVILASIIEKETSLPEEKPLISAVFHNRLQRKIPLQSDPTVIYGIASFNGNLTKQHLISPTPYNTYVISGLPPTPICNPGKESLLAAVSPAPVPFLYFVSKNDGSHHFSSDIEGHNRAVAIYQKTPKKR